MERAKYHLDSLTEAVDKFLADSCTVTTIEEPGHDRVRYRIRWNEPHVYIFLILGDTIQCIRTALDQAVWSLIKHHTGKDSEQSEFPIFREPLTDRTRKKLEDKTRGLPQPAVDFIAAIQPGAEEFKRWKPIKDQPLWQLHELNRIDKHRRISVRTHVSHIGHVIEPITIENYSDEGYDVVVSGPLKERPPEIYPRVEFGDRGISITLDDVVFMYQFVEHVLVRLAGFAISTADAESHPPPES